MKKPRTIRNQSITLSCHEASGRRTIAIKAENEAMSHSQAKTIMDRIAEMVAWCKAVK